MVPNPAKGNNGVLAEYEWSWFENWLCTCSIRHSSETESKLYRLQSGVRVRWKEWTKNPFDDIHVRGNEGKMCMNRESAWMIEASHRRIQDDEGMNDLTQCKRVFMNENAFKMNQIEEKFIWSSIKL